MTAVLFSVSSNMTLHSPPSLLFLLLDPFLKNLTLKVDFLDKVKVQGQRSRSRSDVKCQGHGHSSRSKVKVKGQVQMSKCQNHGFLDKVKVQGQRSRSDVKVMAIRRGQRSRSRSRSRSRVKVKCQNVKIMDFWTMLAPGKCSKTLDFQAIWGKKCQSAGILRQCMFPT